MTMTAASLQQRIFLPWKQISSPSTSASQNASFRVASPTSPSSFAWILTPSRSRLPVESRLGRVSTGVVEDEEEEDALSLYEEELGQEDETGPSSTGNPYAAKVRTTFRVLGNKEKKELRAYAHQLGNDICVHQIGKWGLTANCITAICDALEANELVKIRVLDNLDEEIGDTAKHLAGETGAQVVGKMGRTLLLYRPSMRKLKAAQAAEQKAYHFQKRKQMLASRAKSSASFAGGSRGRR